MALTDNATAQATPSLSARQCWPALLGLFFFAFTFRSSSGAYLLGLLITLGWLYCSRQAPVPKLPAPLLNICKVYFFGLLAHMIWTLWLAEYDLIETLEGYRHFAELLLFIPLSAVLYRCRSYAFALLWVPVLAVVIRVLHRSDFSSLDTTLFSQWIYGFGQHHVTFGMQGMLAILVILAIAAPTVRAQSTQSKRYLAAIVIGATIALLTQALLTSGSRSAWGALLGGGFCLIILNRGQFWRLKKGPNLAIAGALITVLVGLICLNSHKLQERLVDHTKTDFSLTFSIDDLPRDKDLFFARRVHLSYFGFQQWLQRPLLGHGPAATRPMLNNDPDFHIHPHLHNTYIQVPMEIGAPLTLLLAGLFFVLNFLLWQSRPSALDSQRPLYNLIIASWGSLALWSTVGFHLHSSDWRFIVIWYLSYSALMLRLLKENRTFRKI